MPSNERPPGLVIRKNKDRSERLYWEAPKAARELGYEPSIIRLAPESEEHLLSLCHRHQAHALAWLARAQGAFNAVPRCFTISDLFRAYRTREESPFHRVKWNTRRGYSQILDRIENAVGETRLADVNLAMLRRWFESARWPEGRGAGKPEHLTLAHKIIELIRRAVKFGIAAEIEGCERLGTILDNSNFEQPKRRQVSMPADFAQSFVAAALNAGRFSLALGTALQYECALRQKDVIGEWEPIGPSWEARSGIILEYKHPKQWVNGLTWADISDDGILTKITTKTGKLVEHDLNLCPMVRELLARIPPDRRYGPLILDESTGRPYTEFRYYKLWRKVADDAELPKGIRNMDARSGALTEGSEAGAALEDLRMAAGHSDAKTTTRYVRGAALEQSRRVAQLRLTHRRGK